MSEIVSAPSSFQGSVHVPPDKSITHRAVLFSSLASGLSTVVNPLEAEDCQSTLGCVEQLGCRVYRKSGEWKIMSQGLRSFKSTARPLNCGNSGTTIRLIMGILAGQNFVTELVGDLSLSNRPMARVARPLTQMGASFDLTRGQYPPVRVRGTHDLKAIQWANPIASAQVKSAVLLAGLHARGTLIYNEPSLSRDHTERMLQACGAPLYRKKESIFLEGPFEPKPMVWTVPRDFSSAAFFLVAGLLVPGATIECKEVNLNPTRIGLLGVLQAAGAEIEIVNQADVFGEPRGDLRVKGGGLKAFHVTPEQVPSLIDEIPILSVAASQAHGVSVIEGIKELRVKETDRIEAIAQNLTVMGASVKTGEDRLEIEGPTRLKGVTLSSYDDHRIAMAFAIAGLVAEGQTTIEKSEAVSISYPDFWNTLHQLGVS